MQPECSCTEERCREEKSRSGRGQTLEYGGDKGEQRRGMQDQKSREGAICPQSNEYTFRTRCPIGAVPGRH